MTVGLEIYRDGETEPYFDLLSGFIIGQFPVSVGAGGGSGFQTDAQVLEGNPFSFYAADWNYSVLDVSFVGDQIHWTTEDEFDGTVFYGIR